MAVLSHKKQKEEEGRGTLLSDSGALWMRNSYFASLLCPEGSLN